MRRLITFTGKMGSGKSTAIELTREILQGNVSSYKFAAPLYDIQEYIYGVVENVYKRPENFIKDRKLLQWLGTEWGRSLSTTLWVDLWLNKVKFSLENHGYSVTCDDVRYDNEADAVHTLGGIVVLINSNKATKRIDTKSGIAGHLSEQGISSNKIDYVIENNGSLEDLKKALAEVLAKA